MRQPLLILTLLVLPATLWAQGYEDSSTELTAEEVQQQRSTIDLSIFASVDEITPQSSFGMGGELSAFSDIFTSITSYQFSEMRFNRRGYDCQYEDVYLNGIRMNDALTGHSPWSLWSGLNEATRSKESSDELNPFSYGLGSLSGSTAIFARASHLRQGWSTSIVNTNSMYRLRLMATYASGLKDNGWVYAFSVSTRQGDNYYVDGVYYNTFGYFASVEKRFNSNHTLALTILGAPGERGVQSAATQESYDLVGSNYYNPNVGIQSGEERNVCVREYHEPIAMINYEYNISDERRFTLATSLRFGQSGYSALTWYAGSDPRADYYRYLPSYHSCPNPAWVAEQWMNNTNNIQYINLDNLYNINRMGETNQVYGDGVRSYYMIEERHTDQIDFNIALKIEEKVNNGTTINSGLNLHRNRTEYYCQVKDLLGGDYWVDVDKFAERDFASSELSYQNNLEYYLEHGYAQAVREGDKFSYDYYAHILDVAVWRSYDISFKALPSLKAVASGEIGFTTMWREGLWQKGLFIDNSYGDGEKLDFVTYKVKLNMGYTFNRMLSLQANMAYMNEAPTFQNSFISPRTRNSTTPNLDTERIFSADATLNFNSQYFELRLSGYYTTIKEQVDVISFYNDLQGSFDNFALSGIDKEYMGVEAALSVPLVAGFTLQAAASVGEYLYDSNPYYIEVADNSADVISEGRVYWDGLHVESTPQTAYNVGLHYRSSNYLFASINYNYYDNNYISMNPMCRTDNVITAHMSIDDIMEIRSQEKFDAAGVLNASIGKSWYINHKINVGANLEVKNILNNQSIKTGGYEQMRLSSNEDDSGNIVSYTRFDSKYYYMFGTTYYLNIYVRF